MVFQYLNFTTVISEMKLHLSGRQGAEKKTNWVTWWWGRWGWWGWWGGPPGGRGIRQGGWQAQQVIFLQLFVQFDFFEGASILWKRRRCDEMRRSWKRSQVALARLICEQDDDDDEKDGDDDCGDGDYVRDGDCNGTKKKNFQTTLAQKQFEICQK